MPQHYIAALKLTWRRLPAGGNSRAEQFVGIRLVVPHGDPVHRTESGRVEHESRPVRRAENYVMRELVLNDDISRHERRILPDGPPEDLFKCL